MAFLVARRIDFTEGDHGGSDLRGGGTDSYQHTLPNANARLYAA